MLVGASSSHLLHHIEVVGYQIYAFGWYELDKLLDSLLLECDLKGLFLVEVLSFLFVAFDLFVQQLIFSGRFLLKLEKACHEYPNLVGSALQLFLS